MRFSGKTAIVTGAGGVIGAAAARLLHAEGARVALVDLDRAALAAVAADLEAERRLAIVADVTRSEECARYAREAAEKFGPVDVFFNNAGVEGPSRPMVDYPEEDFARVMAVNVTGVFLGLKHVLPRMRDGGAVVITSSTAGLRGSPNFTGYTASKHAVIGLMRTAAVESAPRRIRVNTIHPAMVDSRMMRRIEEARRGDRAIEDVQRQFRARIPMARYIEPEEIAAMVAHLASDGSAMVTGAEIVVDGGSML